ncbi:RNA pol II transcription cofactor [Pestalotiopsis sp. IQ-011]
MPASAPLPAESPNALPDVSATRPDMILAYILGAVFIVFCVFAPCLCTRRYRTALEVEDEDVEGQQTGDLDSRKRRGQRRGRGRRALDADSVPDRTSAAARPPLPTYARHPTQDEVKLAGTPPQLPPPIYQSRLKDTHDSPVDHAG